MAERETIRVDVDVTGVDKSDHSFKKVTKSTDRFEKELNELKKASIEFQKIINGMAGSLKKVSNGMGDAKASAKKAKNELLNIKTVAKNVSISFVALGIAAAAMAFKFVKSMIFASKEMEKFEVQFKVLLKSQDLAQKRMEELSKFAAFTPFQLDEVAKASKILQTLTKGALATGDSLRMVGDAAAISGEQFSLVAMHVGRLYSGLRANRPVGESMMRMMELGIVTGETRNEIEKLQKVGKGREAWEVLKRSLEETSGAMEELSKSGVGLESTIRDLGKELLRQLAEGTGVYSLYKKSLEEIKSLMEWIVKAEIFKFGDEAESDVEKWNRQMAELNKNSMETKSIWQSIKSVVSRAFFPEVPEFVKELRKGTLGVSGGLAEKALLRPKPPEPPVPISEKQLKAARDAAKKAAELQKQIIKENEQRNLDANAKAIDNIKRSYEERRNVLTQGGQSLIELEKWKTQSIQKIQVDALIAEAEMIAKAEEQRKKRLEEENKRANDILKEQKESALQLQDQLFIEAVEKDLVSEEELLNREVEKFQQRKKLLEEHNMSTERLELIHQSNMSAIREQGAKKEKQIEEARLGAARGFVNSFGALAKIAAQRNKKATALAQGFAIANIAFDTAEAAQTAIKTASKTYGNPAGIIIGAAQAAAITAAGLARAQAVESQSFWKGGINNKRNYANGGVNNSGIVQGQQFGDQNTINTNGREMINTVGQQSFVMKQFGINTGVSDSSQQKLFEMISNRESAAPQKTVNVSFSIAPETRPDDISPAVVRRLINVIREAEYQGETIV